MSNRHFLERKTLNENTSQSKYEVGNSVYIVNSHFTGSERLENLLFDIFQKKSIVNNAENVLQA